MRRELAGLRMENNQLRTELSAISSGQAGGSHALQSADPYARGASRPELPPLRSLSSGIANGPESMTGVQYEQPRVNGFRPAEGRF